MPFRRRRMSMGPRPIIKSYKKVLNDAAASRAAGTTVELDLVTGIDNNAIGQTGVVDGTVPTGSIIKYIEIQYACTNLVATSDFIHIAIQKLHSGQTKVSPATVGGNPQRNQVFFQKMMSVGQGQSAYWTIKFRIPKKFQRIREGDKWVFTRIFSAVTTDITQAIYKVYQ